MSLRDWFYQTPDRDESLKVRVFSTVLVLLFLSLVFAFAFLSASYQFHWGAISRYRAKFFRGFGITVLISLGSLILSFFLGMIFALMRHSRILVLRYFSRVYVELIRGTPLLVQILIFYYVVADAFGLQNRYFVGILILSAFSGAYVSEIIRSGIDSVPASQMESAVSLGLSRFQIFRYVVLPQVIRRILPPLTGQFVSLVKDSSLLSIISVGEFTMNAQEVNAFTYATFESYIPLAIGYLALTYPLSLLTRYLEKKFAYES